MENMLAESTYTHSHARHMCVRCVYVDNTFRVTTADELPSVLFETAGQNGSESPSESASWKQPIQR